MASNAPRHHRGLRRIATVLVAALAPTVVLTLPTLVSASAAAAPTVGVIRQPPPVAVAMPEVDSLPPPAPTWRAVTTRARPAADAATLSDAPAPTSIDPIERAVVVLYGDSLAWEARDAFVGAFDGRADVTQRTFGGTAICDWLELMVTDALTIRPGAVVVEFSGNNFTPCMSAHDGTPLRDGALVDRYRADAESVISTFVPVGTEVVFAGAPTSGPNAERPALNEVYERLAREHDGVHYVDAGAAVLDDGRWTATLPCLPTEPCVGGVDSDGSRANVVRAPDGIHFCPAGGDAVDGVTGACPVWSSGAARFGAAMAAPVVEALDDASVSLPDVGG